MDQDQPDPATNVPELWLLSDARNDPALGHALAALPRGSGFIFRHYHLEPAARQARFAELAAIARSHGHCVILSGDPDTASLWGADGVYGPVERIASGANLLRLATAHDAAEVAAAVTARAHAVLISPVFPTRSHDGAATLGSAGFRELARLSEIPAIALGGMDAARARELGWRRWAAIDGLS